MPGAEKNVETARTKDLFIPNARGVSVSWPGLSGVQENREHRPERTVGSAPRALEPTQVNGYPALIVRIDGEVNTVLAVRFDDGLVTGLYAVRNPEKLSHMEQETTLRH